MMQRLQKPKTLLNVNTAKPRKEETKMVIKEQKNGKSPGPDGNPAEILKAEIVTSTQLPYEIFEKIWEKESIAEDRKEGRMVKIPKKGDSTYQTVQIIESSPCFQFPEKSLTE